MRVKCSLKKSNNFRWDILDPIKVQGSLDQLSQSCRRSVQIEGNEIILTRSLYKDEFIWYTLPLQIRNRMMKNQIDQGGGNTDTEFINSITTGFYWDHSLEGSDFWSKAISKFTFDVTEDNWRILVENSKCYIIYDDLGTGEFKVVRKDESTE